MTVEERKSAAIENYKKVAEKAGIYDSFVVKCIESYTEPKQEKESFIKRLIGSK